MDENDLSTIYRQLVRRISCKTNMARGYLKRQKVVRFKYSVNNTIAGFYVCMLQLHEKIGKTTVNSVNRRGET
jgi:hypothetical protein